MSCAPGCRWQGRVLTFARSFNGTFYSPRCGPSLVHLLPGAPVGCVPKPGRLGHREGGLDPRDVVGWIEQARATAVGVDAVIHLVDEAVQIRRALLGLERAQRLRWMGLSIVGTADAFELRATGRVVYSVGAVANVDFVTRPSGVSCSVRRRLPCQGVV